ncbi:MAG: hypothetical protein EOS57_11045 [Mesorhizobium sp.]|uniref:patatin-like phospholipase family protein n=3 Tax=Mesorhizobium TaxID=68287 RepID=UPI000FE52656|nr:MULTISPECIES: hypothetical protein [unclassified Mesorhizobium]RWC36426.1 MAG: hypothetical protein EOS70_03885 [Mesorhizobium sp.]RWD19924.1 MAG: hypothetical protein EOS57_11045 [Mesorhizobium sp.]TGU00481.1 hypothetical protein EN807_11810 [Mesorhizobium sp. M5C.F.Ca.ET.164.01.1.1]
MPVLYPADAWRQNASWHHPKRARSRRMRHGARSLRVVARGFLPALHKPSAAQAIAANAPCLWSSCHLGISPTGNDVAVSPWTPWLAFLGWRLKMHVQTGIETNNAVIAGARPAMDGGQLVDVVLASDAHGAFVWGVLDRLLDEPGLSFGNITASGFSALEAAVLAYGLALAGRRGARTALVNLWRRISHVSVFATNKANPLRSILEQSIDIAELRKKGCPVKLSISASNARTDAVRVFSGDQVSIDAIVAAATVPFLFPAVEIDGETYWGDGDLAALGQVRSVEAGHLLIIAGKPSGFTTQCADRNIAANHGAPKPPLTHTIFDRQHRAGAALFARPWTDWSELTDRRDRGRERAEDWLLAGHLVVNEPSAADGKTRYV